jgi:hypothetical protein
MNLLEILRLRVQDLPEGDYMQGLKSVLQHIEVASRHLERGQVDGEDTAFTDAIYRTNQAFEGSLKEAFRVLAERDPAGERPHDIENYLQQQNILRPRVLAQLTNYRREWRNPSTHDYRLDFDEDEALLAIVTVSAFAIVLIDQITERISFEQAKTVAAEQATPTHTSQSLIERVSSLIEQFTLQFNQTNVDRTDIREVEIIGALAGFLSSAAPELNTQIDARLVPEKNLRVDLLLSSGAERLILEVKRARRVGGRAELNFDRIANYMAISGINQAILFNYFVPNTGKVMRIKHPILFDSGQLLYITTQERAA